MHPSSLFPIRKTRKDASILVSWTLEPLERLLSLRYLRLYIYIHTPILKKEKNVRSWRYYKDKNRSSAYIPRVRITLIQCQSVANQTVDPPSRNEPTTLKKKKKKKTYLPLDFNLRLRFHRGLEDAGQPLRFRCR